MSTKIYDAYRIKKSTDILSVLTKGKEIVKNIIANDWKLLYQIHALSMVEASRTIEKDPEDHLAQRALKMNEDNNIDNWWLEKVMEKAEKDLSYNFLDVYTTCSIFYDRKYWYIKFYPNYEFQYEMINKIVEESNLEDYHYQNQSDPPDGISYAKFNRRAKKWDKLLAPDDNFRNGFQFTLFDAKEFSKLMSKNYYQGKKTNEELYEHLVYKFDKKLKEV